MKKSYLYLLAIVLGLAFSCKDDEEKDVKPDPIIGKWKGDRSEIKANYGPINVYDETDDDFDVTLEFKTDGTVDFTRDGTVTSGTYTVNGDKLSTNVDLQLYQTDGETVFDIVELNDSDLKLEMNEDREVNVPDVGLIEVTINANLEFDRL